VASSAYWKYIQHYYRVLKQRNQLLKNEQVNTSYLESWNENLAFYASKLIYLRMMFLRRLQQHFYEVHYKFTSEKEKARVIYNSCVEIKKENYYTGKKRADIEEEIYQCFYKKLRGKQNEEIKRGYTVLGPHVEDFSIYIDNYDIKKYASQGQQRTAVLSLKIALYNLLEDNNKKAILLLDDVFSELDDVRRKAVLSFIEKKELQCFITSYEKSFKSGLDKLPMDIYKLDNGVLQNEESGKFN